MSVSDLTSLPISKVQRIMKTDGKSKKFSKEAVFAVCIATELMIELLAQKSFEVTKMNKRKMVDYSNIRRAVHENEEFEFLGELFNSKLIKKSQKRRSGVFKKKKK